MTENNTITAADARQILLQNGMHVTMQQAADILKFMQHLIAALTKNTRQ
jgi:hypothetical protein